MEAGDTRSPLQVTDAVAQCRMLAASRCPPHEAVLSQNLECCTNTQHLRVSTAPFSKELPALADMSSCILSSPLRQGGDRHEHLC